MKHLHVALLLILFAFHVRHPVAQGLPILPNCSANQTLTNFFSCINILLEGIPYSDQELCNSKVDEAYRCVRSNALTCFNSICPNLLETVLGRNALLVLRNRMNASQTLDDLLQSYDPRSNTALIYSYICPQSESSIPVQLLNLFGNPSSIPTRGNEYCDDNILVRLTNNWQSIVTGYYSVSTHVSFCSLIGDSLQNITTAYVTRCIPCTLSILLKFILQPALYRFGGPGFIAGPRFFRGPVPINRSTLESQFRIKDINSAVDDLLIFIQDFEIAGCDPSLTNVVIPTSPPTTQPVTITNNRPTNEQCSNRKDLPLFPSCSAEEMLEIAFSCYNIFSSGIPYDDRQVCKSSLEGAFQCGKNASIRCLSGNCSYALEAILSREILQWYLTYIGPMDSLIDVFESFSRGPSNFSRGPSKLTEMLLSYICPRPDNGVPEEVRSFFGNNKISIGSLGFYPCDSTALDKFWNEGLPTIVFQYFLSTRRQEFCSLWDELIDKALNIWSTSCDSCSFSFFLRSVFPRNQLIIQIIEEAIDIVVNFFSTYEEPECSRDVDPQIPFCPNQTITLNNLAVNFGRRDLYEAGASIEVCEETGSPLASATCLPTPNFASNGEVVGEFDESTVIFIECGVRIANITNSTIESLPTLSVLTSAPEVLTETDIATATEILESYINQSEPQQINETVLGLATRTISNLFAGESLTRRNRSDTNRTVEIKSQLLQTLNGFAASVELPPDTEFIEVITPDITVQVRSLPEGESFSENGLVFNLTNFRTSSNVVARVFAGIVTSSNRNRQSTDNSSATMDNIPTVFATSVGSQYPISSNQNTSQVVSVGVQNTSMTNLSVEITFEVDYPPPEMKVKENPVKRQLNQASFVRWDFEAMRWTTSVCDGAPPSRTFQCSQLASYSILFSRRIVPSIAALAIVSYIGSALSIIFLLLTIFIYVSQKELRDNPTTMTLVNICVCLVGVYLFFAIGVGRVSHHQTCNALTFLLHYFTLACLSWMTVNAYQMLKAFTSLTYSIKQARFAFYVLAYGIPFIIVLINFALTVLFLDRQQEPNDPEDINYESLYRARFTCWLQEPSFYWGFILPMGILLLFNIVVFIILLKKVVFRKREVRSTANDRPLADRLVKAITMVVMMGLTWIFGYFLLIPANLAYETTMQWLFTIFNVLQGAVIFYLYCLRRKNIRSVWFNYRPSWFMLSESNTSGTSRTGKSRSTSATEEYTKNTPNI